eukprot:m.345041 g.345041  ORF g.345041 m.345041 type:complete len:51 (+) comp20652_c0_seq2:469-621(+)
MTYINNCNNSVSSIIYDIQCLNVFDGNRISSTQIFPGSTVVSFAAETVKI